MRVTNIFLLSFILVLGSCTVYEAVSDEITGKANEIQIIDAGFNNWVTSSSKGTDLAVIVENWPEGASPSHVIYNNRKSISANITTTSDIGLIINARIVSASSPRLEKSDSVNLSDRLIYVGPDGNADFIEINEWRRIDEQDEQQQ